MTLVQFEGIAGQPPCLQRLFDIMQIWISNNEMKLFQLKSQVQLL